MPRPNDGGFNDESVDDESVDDEPVIQSFSLVAIDDHVSPSLYCPNRHIIQWKNFETGVTLTYLNLMDTAKLEIIPICLVCGQPADPSLTPVQPTGEEDASTES